MAYQEDAPASLILPRAHEDEVMRLVADTGLDHTEFTWAVRSSLYAPRDLLISALVHTPTDSSFRFDFLESTLGLNRVSIFKPGEYLWPGANQGHWIVGRSGETSAPVVAARVLCQRISRRVSLNSNEPYDGFGRSTKDGLEAARGQDRMIERIRKDKGR